jgi:hypothetical protein
MKYIDITRDENEIHGSTVCTIILKGNKPYEYCIYIRDDAVELFEDILMMVNNNYDHWGKTIYTNIQMNILKNELVKRLNDLENNNMDFAFFETWFDEGWNNILRKIYVEYKDDIINVLKDFTDWLENIKEGEIIIMMP